MSILKFDCEGCDRVILASEEQVDQGSIEGVCACGQTYKIYFTDGDRGNPPVAVGRYEIKFYD